MSDELTSPVLPVDLAQRQQALDISQSFSVSAPAGSGKTELLTQRLLKLLASVDEPEQILAITFTRKASAEMRERLLASLHAVNGLSSEGWDSLDSHKKETYRLAQSALAQNDRFNWQLLENPQRLRIQTIDSLCNAIAAGEPIASRLGGALQPVDDATLLYADVVDQYMNEVKRNALTEPPHPFIDMLEYFQGRQYLLKDLLVAMLPAREQWLPYAGELVANRGSGNENVFWRSLEDVMTKYIEETLVSLQSLLEPYSETILELLGHGYKNLQAGQFSDGKAKSFFPRIRLDSVDCLPSPTVKDQEIWLAILELFFVEAGTPRKAIGKDIGFPADSGLKGEEKALNKARKLLLKETAATLYENQDIRDIVERVRALPIGAYPDSSRNILHSIAFCLRELCAYLYLHFSETGHCDHSEIQAAALRALDATTEDGATQSNALAYQWHKNIHHILVDEFQDTSVSQFRLIEALTRDWHHEEKTASNQRTLFVVGDGMQSIYAFREAKVGLFLRAKQHGIGSVRLTSLELTQNFRSTSGIVNWINQRFESTFPVVADWSRGAVSYSPSAALVNENEPKTSSVLVKVVVDDCQDRGLASDCEAQIIVGTIQAYTTSNKCDSVAVLVRSKRHALPIIAALEEKKLAWRGVEMYPLRDREVVQDMISLYRACSNLSDDIAWWAILRAPWCGLRLEDMQRLKQIIKGSPGATGLSDWLLSVDIQQFLDFSSSSLAALSDEAIERLGHIVSHVQAHWRNRSRRPVRQEIQSLWIALGGNYLARSSILGDDRLSTEAFFNMIEELDIEQRSGSISLSADVLSQRIDKLFAESVEQTPREDEIPVVQVMTIHKSKGLEFDMVVLPALDRKPRANDMPILASRSLVFRDGGEGAVLSPRPKTKLLKVDAAKRTEQSVYSFLREEQKKADSYETDRLFYVAATRAKKHLLLTSILGWDDKKDVVKAPAKGSLLAPHWDALASTEEVDLVALSDSGSSGAGVEQAEFCQIPLRRFRRDFFQTLAVEKNNQEAAASCAIDHAQDSEADRQNAVSSEQAQGVLERAAGLLFHDLAEQLCNHSRVSPDAENAVATFFEAVALEHYLPWRLETILRENGWRLALSDQQQVCTTLGQLAITLRDSETFCWLHSSEHACREAELGLSVANQENKSGIGEGNPSESMRIDYTFIDGNDCRWVIDYKLLLSSADAGLTDRELDLEEQNKLVTIYREQLAKYLRAIELFDQREGQSVAETRAALYLPMTDQLIEIRSN